MKNIIRMDVLSVVSLSIAVLLAGCEPQSSATETVSADAPSMTATLREPTFDVGQLGTDLGQLALHYGVPGMAVVVIEDGEPVYQSGFGVRNIQSGAPVTPDTVFRAGSVTKQFTAALIGMAEDAGRLTLDNRPGQYLDNVEIGGQTADQPVRIENLLTHTSGLGNMDGSLVFFPPRDRQEVLSRLPHLPVTTGANEAFSYSNMGYTLAGIIAAPDGFDAALEDKILAPLGMSRSTMSFARMSEAGNVAKGYARVGGEPYPVSNENFRYAGPAGGLNTTASDLGKWIVFLLSGGVHEGKSLLSKDFVQRATHPNWPKPEDMSDPISGYGYGFFVDTFDGALRVSHGGNTSGYSSLVDFIPDRKIGVAIMTNQQNSDVVYQAANIVYAHILDLEAIDISQIQPRITEGRSANDVANGSVSNRPDIEIFTGTYFDPGYGKIRIRQNGEQLFAEFPTFTLPTQYVEGTRFLLTWTEGLHQNIPTFEMTFVLDDDGQVTGLALPLRLGDEVFTRVPDAQ